MSTIKVDTVRPVTTDGSLTLQGDSSGSGVSGITIDSAGNVTVAGAFTSQGIDDNATSNALTLDSSSNLKFNSGYGSVATAYGCRAWVNFNGTGTVAIRASGNVSSITDNTTGNYTVNFATAMPDTDYCLQGTGNKAITGSTLVCQDYSPTTARTTSSITIRFEDVSINTTNDTLYAQVAIFR
jgi:hypothetical protein